MSKLWIVHEKVRVSKEFDETIYTSLSSKRIGIETLSDLLELIKPKGQGIIMYDGENDLSLTLVDPRLDVER